MSDIITPAYLMLWIGNGISCVLYWYMHKTFFIRRSWTENRKLLVAAVYLLDSLIVSAANTVEMAPVNMIASVFVFFFPLLVCYKLKPIRGFVYYLYYEIAMVLLEVGLGLYLGKYENDMGIQTQYEAVTPFLSVVMNLGEILVVLAICRIGNKEKNSRLNKISLPFIIVPFISVLLLVIEQTRLVTGKMKKFNPEQFIWTAIVLMIVNILVFILLDYYTKIIKRDMELISEKHKLQSDADIMSLAAKSMKERLDISDQMIQQDRVMRHDRRHFEATLLSLLQTGKVDDAIKNLEERLAVEPKVIKHYCDNTTVNAAVSHYVAKAEEDNIKMTVDITIPAFQSLNEMEFAITISNLLENAINACKNVPEENRFINFISRYKKQLLIEISNSCDSSKVIMDEENHPVSQMENHGIGTKSVLAFANKTESEIDYSMKDNQFCVRMLVNV